MPSDKTLWRNWKFLLSLLFSGFTGLIPTAVPAQTTVEMQIREAVTDFILEQAAQEGIEIEIAGISIDKRIGLPVCSNAPEAYLQTGRRITATNTVGVRCEGQQPWKLFVPVSLRQPVDAVVAARAIDRNTTLQAEDLMIERIDATRLRGRPVADIESALGMQVRFNLAAGTPLSDSMLAPVRLIRRGEQVTVIAGGPGIAVTMTGVALSDGMFGSSLEIRNPLSKKVISGTVSGPGEVSIP